jgi:OHCU decarboxylase
MNATLAGWNKTDDVSALEAMMACCGAHRWAAAMIAHRPAESVAELSELADRVWSTMEETDWLEAFRCHPRIGNRKSVGGGTKSEAWSSKEQCAVEDAEERVLAELAEENAAYEKRYGFTFIVYATGKSAAEMLAILKRRLNSDRMTELREAAEQQRRIMQIRLGKWLVE